MTFSPDTPAARGYRMPAEWEPHAATWIGWPHRHRDWPGKFAAIPWVFGEIVRKISESERVFLFVNDERHEAKARRVLKRAGVAEDRVRFFRFRTDRGWTRDFGPITLRKDGEPLVVDFAFNAWAKYPEWELDNRAAAWAAGELEIPLAVPAVNGERFVLEGGAIDVNGAGDVLTTKECLLDTRVQPRNPHLSRGEIEQALGDFLGAANVIWLRNGIAGDDTHGHIDDLCRFVSPDTVVLCREDDPGDPNYAALCENRERLDGTRLQNGSRLSVIDLPMPHPLFFDGMRLPASYANFYITNEAVLVPTFNDSRDREALGILQECFSGRRVSGIHAVDLVWGFGTLHCLTQQLPATPAVS